MSIVIALGVTTPETSYSDMAAGSDPESVEASPAVNEKNYPNHSCGSAQSHGYRGLPYADHNYGAPPPPTPPASPLSQTIIPRMELNGVVRSRYHDGPEDNSADSDSSSEEDGAVTGWCHCSLTADSIIIKCENCRGLDRRKGGEGQRRKPENVSAGESSATESGDEEVSAPLLSYTATQHTPTSITLTVNRVKRNKSKKRKKSTEKARGAPKGKKVKAFREGSRKSMRMKNSTTEVSTLDESTAEGWETKIRQWTEQYEEATANQYSADIQTLLQLRRAASTTTVAGAGEAEAQAPPPPPAAHLQASVDTMDNINRTELACNNTVLGSQMQLQLGRVTRVQKHRKILRAAKDLEPDTLIIEYRGKVMLKQQFEVNGHFFKKPYPFVLFYSKFNEVEICVDARTLGNDARFIRRSCTPNAEVRHMIAEGMIHLCIYAVSQITKDAEVTIAFDYEFNSCNYKVDCACHKGNQNCPVQKHNLSPRETLLCPPSLPPPSSLAGAETRRRKARRREQEGGPAAGGTSDDSNQPSEEPGEARELLQGASDGEDGLLDGVKLEEGEEGEVDENGVLISSRRAREEHGFDSLEKRRKRLGGLSDAKQEGMEPEDGAGNPAGGHPPPQSTGVGVSTRRTTYVSEPSPAESEKAPPTSSAPSLPAPAAPPKPPPARSSKPRPKSRISRYRSSSSQRARRQRQALAQQAAAAAAAAAAAEQGAALAEEGPQGLSGAELGLGDGSLGGGQLLDGDAQGALNRGNLRYPKTKKYLVTEWLNDKVPDKVPEVQAERPLRITTDPTVLATTLNMLPGLSQPPLICTAPKHYVRFGSPFNPERRRPRPLNVDGTYGCYKKRWIKQAEDESCSASLEDGTESTSSHQSNSSSSTPNPLCSDLTTPFKKRRAKYASEMEHAPSEHLPRPLSPITPPLPSDPLYSLLSPSCGALLQSGHHLHHQENGLAFSPLPSLPTSRCNTPLQFENISSPETSPVHRPESISPEPCRRVDFDAPRPPYLDLSQSSSPVPTACEDFTTCPAGHETQGLPSSSAGAGSLTPVSGASSDPAPPSREQAFRTEFNLIYTCSPLNANLGHPAADRRLSPSEGGFSPAESFYGSAGSQGLLAEAGPGSMSPYGEPHYGGYPDGGTPPHTTNPPQKKKVSLLEYRKRKQGSSRDPEPGTNSSSLGTPTRPPAGPHGATESPVGPRSHFHHHLLPPASPHSSFSSPAHPSSSIPQIEEVSPPDHHHHSNPASAPQQQLRAQEGSSHWMVPTTVERLREGQGVLERVLRGSIKMDRMMKRAEGSAGDKDPDADRYEIQTVSMASPMKSPHRYSGPSLFSHQPPSSESHQQGDSPAYLQPSASSPFRGSYSPSAPPSSGPGFYPRLSSQSTLAPNTAQTTSTSSSADSRPPGASVVQPSSSSSMDGSHVYSGSHLKASLLNSGPSSGSPTPGSRAHGNAKTDSGAATGILASHASRLSQQHTAQTLKPGSPGQAVLQAGSRLLSASGAQHYPQRGAPLSQFQHPPLQGPGVRTQSGSF